MVVSSGGGLHIYWVVADEIDSIAWVKTAAALKQLAHYYGLKIDDARTTDTSSVLRVAGTFNHKRDEPRPVLVYKQTSVVNNQAFLDLVKAAVEDAGLNVKSLKGSPAKGAASRLGTNTQQTFDGPLPTMLDLLEVCPQIRRIARVEGATSAEPEWYATAGALKFVQDGRRHFQHISQGHRDYNAEATDDKFDQWQAGPVSCEKMESSCGVANAHICQGCPFRTVAKYPTIAAHKKRDPPEQVATMLVDGVVREYKIAVSPLPWRRSRDKGIVLATENGEDRRRARKVYPYDIYPLDRSTNESRETESQQWRVHLPHGITNDVKIPAATFVDDRLLQSRLADRGVYITDFVGLKTYMSAYIQELQRINPTSEQHNHLGWVDGFTKFVFPTKTIMPDGSDMPTQLAKVAASSKSYITQAGTLQRQAELMRFYRDHKYAGQQMFVLASLASPLFHMTGHSGVIIHAYGESGGSKSSALYSAASIWGDPKKYVLNCTNKGATELYRATRLGVLNNLPCCLDEITSIKEEVAKDFAIGASQSGGRVRSNRDGTPQESLTGEERSSIILSTANVSLQSLLAINNAAGVAGAVRVFEIRFDTDLGVHTPMEADAYLLDLFENHGFIGENFMRLIVAKREQVKAAVRKTQDELATAGGMKSHERFWFSGAASSLVAGDISGKLGYVRYDLPFLREWFLQSQLPEMRGTIKDQTTATSPLATLMDYLAHINGNILRTKRFPGREGSYPIDDHFRGQLLAHQLIDQKQINVLKQDFRDYCTKVGRYSQEVLSTLSRSGVVTGADRRLVLGEGTDLAKGRAWCFTVNLAHPDIAAIGPKLAAQKSGEG